MSKPSGHVFLTGLPGVGKTTLIKEIVKNLKSSGIAVQGFYTEELREQGIRVGFDVVTLCGTRAPLARIDVTSDLPERSRNRHPKVGKYFVKVNEFEKTVVPVLQPTATIVVIDEVGKMELFSAVFKRHVNNLLNNNAITVLGTIPIKKGNGIPFVENIRMLSNVSTFEVTFQNRDNILKNILQIIDKSKAL